MTPEELVKQETVSFDFFHNRPILGKLLILSYPLAKQFKHDKPWACISITDEGFPWPYIDDKNRVDLLQLDFDDIDFPRNHFKLFEINQAEDIWEFVDKIWDKIDLLMVHCAAGISRSSAVAKAVLEKYQPEAAHWVDKLFYPNRLVYSTLKETQNGDV